MKHFLLLENDGTSISLGAGCGEIHFGLPGLVEVCEPCAAAASASGIEVASADDADDVAPKRSRGPKA